MPPSYAPFWMPADIYGSAREFHAGVRATLPTFSGSVDAFASEHHLRTKALGRGLEPVNGSAIFAANAAEIATRYSASGPPVPILVEYRQIPGRHGLDGAVRWAEPVRVELTITTLSVQSDGTWGATPWDLHLSCLANGAPVDLQDSFVWRGDTNDGGNYPINRPWTLDLFAGDHVACGIGGSYSGPIAGTHSLPEAFQRSTISIDRSTALTDVMVGGDNTVSFSVTFTLRAIN
jgi:hypothetical protein